MADSNSSTVTLESNPQQSQDHPNPPNQTNPHLSSSTPPQAPPSIPAQSSPIPSSFPAPIRPPLSYAPPPVAAAVPPSAPSFRPVAQFTPVMPQNPIFQNPRVQTPAVQPPGTSAGAAGAPIPVPAPPPMMAYQIPPPGGQPPNPALRPPFALVPNGFAVIHGGVPQGTIPIPGLPRYPSPYPAMVRPVFPPRPLGAIGVLPRPPIPGVCPIIPPIIRPVIVPSITPAEKPLTTVYVGKISPTVENDFILSLLQFCGPVKSWKRAQDPSNGAPKGFGFCEFESAEGVLRALRLLSKFNIDGQGLVLNVDQATRGYLEKYVEKKTENFKKLKEAETATNSKEDDGAAKDEKNEPPKPAAEQPKEGSDSESKDNDNANFGAVTDDDREADREAMEKLTSMIEERLKMKPLPPPPALTPGDVPGNSNVEAPTKSRDGDSDPDIRNDVAEEKHDDELTSDNKQGQANENDKTEMNSLDRSKRHDRRCRERDRDRDLKREKEREIERYERETERERVRKEREHRRKIEEADRQFEEYLKDWEYREREKEKLRHYEKEKEKERERKRKKEVIYEEEEEEDEDSRKRWRRSALEEKRKRRQREKEDDLYDRQKEEEEIAEAKREEEDRLKREQEEALKSLSDHVTNGTDRVALAEESAAELKDTAMEEDDKDDPGRENHTGDGVLQNGINTDEPTMASVAASDTQHGGNVTTKKLGFGLVGSGKRTAVPSLFSAEDDDEAQKEKKMRPLVPIDYSTEEIQAVQQSASGAAQPNLVAAAEFAKRLANPGSKEEKADAEKERSKRSRHESKEKAHDADHGQEKTKATENKKLIDAKQLIDMIPRTKEELFSFQINWAVYDEHALHERMRPWISKKITEFLGEEEETLVDYIVSSTQEHVEADHMLHLLQSILDEEAEMFVLKMWRMLIFEIKKVETGLSSSRNRT